MTLRTLYSGLSVKPEVLKIHPSETARIDVYNSSEIRRIVKGYANRTVRGLDISWTGYRLEVWLDEKKGAED